MRAYRAIVLMLVMLKWLATCIFHDQNENNDPEGWKQLQEQLHLMMTQLLQKRLEMAGRHKEGLLAWQRERPTMYIASMDIKTAFDVRRAEHIANILGGQEAHGWIAAAPLRGMKGLKGHADFENVESKFHFARCIRQGGVNAPTLWLKLAQHYF